LLLLLLTSVRKFGDFNSAMVDTPVLESILKQPILSTALGFNLALFFAALVALHLVLGVATWSMARLSEVAWPKVGAKRIHWVFVWMIAFSATILVANASQFPYSSLGEPYAGLARVAVLGVRPHAMAYACLLVGVACTLVAALLRRPSRAASPLQPNIAVLVATLACGFLVLSTLRTGAQAAAPAADRPNIILIGIDAFRPELLTQPDAAANYPNLSQFVHGSTHFSNAITPLARTFPAWMALLSGKHPHTTGATINLLPRSAFDVGATLPAVLSQHGYETVYATDEVRFANIDTTYGFTRTVTPPIGASDFLIGFIGDSPLANLLVNTAVGRWLFPHLHANRAAAHLYDPDVFVDSLAKRLPRAKPLHLAVHLTLPHWPYIWRDSPPVPGGGRAAQPHQYLLATQRVDQQFGELLQRLEANGALDHAIVVLFSDHGESFGRPSETLLRGTTGLGYIDELAGSVGHGTSVLSPHQFRVALAFRGYGKAASVLAPRGALAAPVTLEDVTPTLLELAAVANDEPRDGHSLVPLLTGRESTAIVSPERIRFTETEFDPAGLFDTTGKLSASTIASAVTRYRIDPLTDRIELRAEWIESMERERQFAALGPTKILAAIPNFQQSAHSILVIDIAGGLPRRIVAPPDANADPEVAALWQALHGRFGERLANVEKEN
jgi:hypothetical protein